MKTRSPAQLATLKALHNSRRGLRVNRSLPRTRDRILDAFARAVRQPERGVRSIRTAAAACGVSDRTARRWLSGVDWPPAQALETLAAWLKSVR